MVEKPLTTDVLETGEIPLSDAEAERLGFPAHATERTCMADGNEVIVQWRPGPRLVSGEQLRDHLQLHGSVGGIVQLHRAGDRLELRCLRHGHTAVTTPPVNATELLPRLEKKKDRKPRLHGRRYALRDRREYCWDDRVGIHNDTIENFLDAIKKRSWDSATMFDLRLRGEKLAVATGFDELLAIDLARVDHMPHQEATVVKVLRQMHGRAVLADEVGLGKTIEAGLIMKELIVRGIARRVLVLCPAGLREQWREELDKKFDEPFAIAGTSAEIKGDRLIMSIHLARNNQKQVHAQRWDLVIVDEAHKEINGPKTRQLLANLDTRYMLFLTATPVQNRLTDLYNLIELLRPGTFASRRAFERRFVDENDPRQPVNVRELRQLVADVMVRTTREQVGLDKVQRCAVDVPIRPSNVEREVYHLCTDGLRHVMTSPGDSLRRRQLALRLTTSPRSLAATARKLARNHHDARVQSFLRELSELAVDFGRTTRQAQLLEVVRTWMSDADKGKVVVFTQHADTLDDLVRVLTEEGIDASVYHGGLSASARQAAIEQFRRSAPVMLSTDAGAEGLNLQFANCVVNYDLPWNPMRVEQRIGRVHRLTQQKRQVYIANFFATGTIDEQVYRLLHDKLRMFELLFGQVTTILGELDGRQGGETFETRILNAYLAPSDAEMRHRIDQLGRQLDVAYDRARRAARDDAGISSWFIDRSYREKIRNKPADELRPAVEIGQRQRQQEVLQFALDFFHAFGAKVSEVEHELISVGLPPVLVEDFGGREELHLAFSSAALDMHRDAELCAAGSQAFEEMLAALRERGALHAAMPVVGDVQQKPWLPHAPNLSFKVREVLGPDTWAAQTVWRTQCDGVDAGEDVRVITIGDPERFATKRHRDWTDGEALPDTISADEVLETVISESLGELRKMRDLAEREVHDRMEAERTRILNCTAERIAELQREIRSTNAAVKERAEVELDHLTRLRNFYEERRPGTVELRAELLALKLVGSPVLRVREIWADDRNREVHVEALWTPSRPFKDAKYRDGAGRPIAQLAVCMEGHAVDAERVRRCPACCEDVCDLCDSGAFAECRACGVEQCGRCFGDPSRVCPACAAAERAPELDREGQVGWSLGFGAKAIVGEGVARIVRSDGTELVVLKPSLPPELRQRMAAIARAFGGPLDLGGRYFGLSELVLDRDDTVLFDRREDVTWEVVPGGGSAIDVAIGPLLADAEVHGWDHHDDSAALEALLASLRQRERPEPAPQLVARETRHDRYLESRGDQVWWVELWQEAGHEPRVGAHQLEFRDAGDGRDRGSRAVANAPGMRVEVRRVHRSALVEVTTQDGRQQTFFVPGAAHATPASEAAARDVIAQRGLPPNTALFVAVPRDTSTFACPSAATLVERRVEEEWIAEPGEMGEPFSPLDARRFVLSEPEVRAETLSGECWSGLLLPVEADPVPYTLVPYRKVTEVWQGESATTRTYLVRSGEPAYPILDDTGRPGADFGVDRAGHLASRVIACTYCETLTCPACSDAALPCELCGVQVCGRCAAESAGAHLCDACGSLRRMRWLRRLVARGGRRQSLAGRDKLHRLVFVAGPEGPHLIEIRNDKRTLRPLALSDRQAELLNEVAGGPWFSVGASR